METKIEYQLTLEMAEKLAVEQKLIQLVGFEKNRWFLPDFLGIIGAVIMGFVVSKWQIGGNNYSTDAKAVIVIIGFFLGFGLGYLFHKWVRSEIISRARKQTRFSYTKLGTSRTISWDAEWINISRPNWKNQIKWQSIDGLRNEPLGIHLMQEGQSIFGFPKSEIPPTFTADDLIKTWQGYLAK